MKIKDLRIKTAHGAYTRVEWKPEGLLVTWDDGTQDEDGSGSVKTGEEVCMECAAGTGCQQVPQRTLGRPVPEWWDDGTPA